MMKALVKIARGLAFTLACTAVFAGCAGDAAIREAEAALSAARGAHADYLSPGEYRSAENWLAEARVRLREADFDEAVSYAHHAASAAQNAYNNALGAGMPESELPPAKFDDDPPPTPADGNDAEPTP